jgi:hypothetical protein
MTLATAPAPAQAKGARATELELYFARPDTPSTNSAVGALMRKILAKFPEITLDAAREKANQLLLHAAGKKKYRAPRVLSEAQLAKNLTSLQRTRPRKPVKVTTQGAKP